MYFNRSILAGRLVADPELRHTQAGVSAASFRMAVDRRYKSANGDKVTDFINVVAWRKAAELICQYVKKGHELLVEGELQMRQYQTKEGEKRTVYEVVVDNFSFGSKPSGEGGYDEATPAGDLDDDLPF